MAKLAILYFLLVACVVADFQPLIMVVTWHLVSLVISAGMFFLLPEEDGDLDSGIVGFAILLTALAGVLLDKLVGLSWLVTLAFALPSLSMTAMLLMKGKEA
jgi:hypothetical protein